MGSAVLTVSDGVSQGVREDESGQAAEEMLLEHGLGPVARRVVPDERAEIEAAVVELAREASLVVTTGGTGFGPRDVTPEATRAVVERPAPGIAELLRLEGAKQTPMSWLSRGECGIAASKFIINLPGSPKAMPASVEILKPLLLHAL